MCVCEAILQVNDTSKKFGLGFQGKYYISFTKIGRLIMFKKAVPINSEKRNESYYNNLRAKSKFLNAEYGNTNNYHYTAYLLDISRKNHIFLSLKL
jgi:hypothetical protein